MNLASDSGMIPGTVLTRVKWKKIKGGGVISQNTRSPSRDLKPVAPAVLTVPTFGFDNLRPRKCSAVSYF